MALQFKVISVTPEIAHEWISKLAPDQRKLRDHVVAQYARDMIRGAWRLTHQSIAFDEEGRLIDGQHRLQAVIESGQTVQMTVATDVKGGYGLPIDGGFRRTPSDLLHLPIQVISTSIVLRKLQRDSIRHQERSSTTISIDEIRETYDRYREDVDMACRIIRPRMATSAAAGAVAFARPIDPERTDLFIDAVSSGANLNQDDPALTLRNWFMRTGTRRISVDVAMATSNAVSAYLREDTLRNVYTTPSGYEALCAKRRSLRLPDTPPTRAAAAKEVNGVQDKVLKLLRADGLAEFADICNRVGSKNSVVSDALYKLKKKGLVHSPEAKFWAISDPKE